jgi:hypothetical protein
LKNGRGPPRERGSSRVLGRAQLDGCAGRAAEKAALIALTIAALHPAAAPTSVSAAPRPSPPPRAARTPAPAARKRQHCEEPPTGDAGSTRAATVSLDGDSAAEVLFDPQAGRVTLCVFDRTTGEPRHLRADVISLYVTLPSAPAGPPPIRVWLDPVESEHDALGVPRATRFSGESPQLRGLAHFDGLFSQILVRGTPFWGVAVHLPAPPAARGR